MLFFGSPNVEKLKANRDVKGLIKALEYKINKPSLENIKLYVAAAQALRELKNMQAVEPLYNTLGRRNEMIKWPEANSSPVRDEIDRLLNTIIAALVELRDPRAIPALLDALMDISWIGDKISKEIIEALAKFGAQSVEPLVNLLENVSPKLIDQLDYKSLSNSMIVVKKSKCQERICDTLVMIGEPSVDSLIAMYIKSNDYIGKDYLSHITKALKEICAQVKDTALHTRVVKVITSQPIWIRRGVLDDTNAHITEIMKKIGLQLEDPMLRAQVIGTLAEVATMGNSDAKNILVSLGSKAVESLIASLQSFDPKIYKERAKIIAEVLGDIGDKRAIEPIINLISNFGMPYSVAENLKKLGWQPDNSKAGAAYWAYEKKWNKCMKIGSPAFEVLVQALEIHKGDTSTLEPIARALGKLGDERAVIPLIKLLLSAHAWDSDFVEQITKALAEIGEPALEAINAIIHPDPFTIRPAIPPSVFDALVTAKEEIIKHIERNK